MRDYVEKSKYTELPQFLVWCCSHILCFFILIGSQIFHRSLKQKVFWILLTSILIFDFRKIVQRRKTSTYLELQRGVNFWIWRMKWWANIEFLSTMKTGVQYSLLLMYDLLDLRIESNVLRNLFNYIDYLKVWMLLEVIFFI